MTAPEHSPLPWRDDDEGFGIVDANGSPVAIYGAPPQFAKEFARRQLIIAAVNSHADLLAAAKLALTLLLKAVIEKAEEPAP